MTREGLQEFRPPGEERLRWILERGKRARVLVIGDFCLDIYWFVDRSVSEISLETGLPTHPVREQRYSPGGAGNVAVNLVAAGCGRVLAAGVIGGRSLGRQLSSVLRGHGISVEDLLVQQEGWDTPAYGKPHLDNRECSRFDFGNFNLLSAETARDLLSRCSRRIAETDVVIVNQQLRQGSTRPCPGRLDRPDPQFNNTTFVPTAGISAVRIPAPASRSTFTRRAALRKRGTRGAPAPLKDVVPQPARCLPDSASRFS